MTYRFYITRNERREVFPLNFSSTSLIDEREEGKVFRRRTFNGTLVFGGSKSVIDEMGMHTDRYSDFNYFLVAEQDFPCTDLIFEIEKDGNPYWRGTFATSDGQIDLDKCTFSVTPRTLDQYTIFDEKGDDQYNILRGSIQARNVRMRRMVTRNVITEFEYTRCFLLKEVIQYIAEQIVPGVEFQSTFLNAATNPVTLATNRYLNVMIAQKSDIKRWQASDKAWRGMLSFNEIMEICKIMNLYWTYEEGVLRVEHISYFTYDDGMDLRSQPLHKAVRSFSYDKNNMPARETYSFMESQGMDFVPHTMTYFSECFNKNKENNTVNYSWEVTTDIEYIQDCMADPDKISNISDDGWVLLSTYWDAPAFRIYMSYSTNPEYKFNGDLGWSMLLRTLHMHDRPVPNGAIAGAPLEFYSTRKIKIQECSAIVCDDFDASELVTTELGEDYFGGIKATVIRAELFPTGLTRLVLGYGYPNKPIVPVVYRNLVIVEEKGTELPYIFPITYYAQLSRPADNDLTVSFRVRMLTQSNSPRFIDVSISIANGQTAGTTTVFATDPDPADPDVCRYGITNFNVTGSSFTWSMNVNYDRTIDCV